MTGEVKEGNNSCVSMANGFTERSHVSHWENSQQLHSPCTCFHRKKSSSSVFFSVCVLKACQVSDSRCCPVGLETSKKLLAQLLEPRQMSGLLGLATGKGVVSYLHEPDI